MTSTTSKLGADMTDFQINLLASHYWEIKEVMGVRTDKFDAVGFARALLARQPAAIGKQEPVPSMSHANEAAVAKEYDLDESTVRDLWNEFVGMLAAPSVEQDERERFDKALMAYAMEFSESIDAEKIRVAHKRVMDLFESRAASTSANVAQGAEAVADPKHDLHARMKIAREAGLQLRIDGKFGSDHYHSVTGSWPAVCRFAWALYNTAAPPAQTALTDDVLMQAIADTAARGHVWASRALSNFRAVVRQVSKSPNDA